MRSFRLLPGLLSTISLMGMMSIAQGADLTFKELPAAVQKAFSASLHGDTSVITSVTKLERKKNLKGAIYSTNIPQGPGMVLQIRINELGEVLFRGNMKCVEK